MKRSIYIAGVILCAVVTFLVFNHRGKQPEPIPQEVTKPAETLAQRAYRLETTIRKAPQHYSPTRKKVHHLEETFRVTQAKIRRSAGRDGQKMSQDWRAFKRENKQQFDNLRNLRELIRLEKIEKSITSKYGEQSPQLKTYHALQEMRKNNSISPIEFYKELKAIK